MYLVDNKIENIDILSKVKFSKLKYLNLNGNKIKSIDVFTNIPFINLQRLDLEYNQISNIDSFIKSPFINLKHLGLRDNHLDEHEPNTAKIIKELKEKYKNIDLVLSQPEHGPLL